MELIRLLNQRDDVPPDAHMSEQLATAANESDFGDLGIDLLTSIALNIQDLINASMSEHGRDAGILRGLAVRTVKLLDRLVDELTMEHGDLESIYLRLIDDTLITIGYLVATGPAAYDEYLGEAVTAQRRRKETIERNIAERGGVPEPIETRQLQAIAGEISLAGLPTDGGKPKRMPPVDQRISAVFPDDNLLYDFGFWVGSDGVHGG